MNKTKKLITFDLYDTLIKPKFNIGKHYGLVCENHGIKLNINELGKNFTKSYKNYEKLYPNMGYGSGLNTFNWWKLVAKDTLFNTEPSSQILKQNFNSIFADIYSKFSKKENYHLFEDVIPLLEELRLKDKFELGIISNMDERARDILKEFNLIQYFNYILLSRECGIVKPDPRIFLKMNELTQIEPVDCYHIGDDYEKDFKSCEKAGWNGYWLNREGNNNNQIVAQVPQVRILEKLTNFKNIV